MSNHRSDALAEIISSQIGELEKERDAALAEARVARAERDVMERRVAALKKSNARWSAVQDQIRGLERSRETARAVAKCYLLERDEARKISRFCRMILHAEGLGPNLSDYEAKCLWLMEEGDGDDED